MLLPSVHTAMLLGLSGLVLLLVTVQPEEHRGVRVGLCLTVAAAVFLYLDWRTALLFQANSEDIHGALWVWGFYLFEWAAFGEFLCGSAAMIRRQALLDIGGFVTVTAIEDQATAVKLLSKGYKTRYLNEPLSVGLAPESNAVLHDQRNRWCRGSLQILFTDFGPFGRGLRLIHRLFFLQSHWVLNALSPLMYVLCPSFFLWFGWNPFPTPRPLEIFGIPICLSVIIMAAMLWLGRRQIIPFFWQGFQLFMAFELLPQALASLAKPFGKPLLQITPVTAKGQAAVGGRIDLRTLSCLLALMLLIVIGLVRAGYDERLGGEPLEMTTLLLWTVYAMSIVTIAGLICVEPWYRRRAERFDLADEPASLWLRGQAIPVQLINLSVTGARIRLQHPLVVPLDQPMHLQKRRVGLIPCTLAYMSHTELAVEFLPSAHQNVRQASVREVYTNPVVQGTRQATFVFWPVVKRLGRPLVAWS